MDPKAMQAEIDRLTAELAKAKAEAADMVSVKLNATSDMVVVRLPRRKYPFSFYKRDFSFFTPEVLAEAKALAETIDDDVKITPEKRRELREASGEKFRY